MEPVEAEEEILNRNAGSLQHHAIVAQMGQAYWQIEQFNNLGDEIYAESHPVQAACRLYTVAHYRAHHERLFRQALDTLI